MSNAEEEYLRKTDTSARFDFKKEEKSATDVTACSLMDPDCEACQ